MPPKSTRRAFILGSASPASISLLSFSMISVGVFLGVLGRILQNRHVYTIPHARRVPDYDSWVHATEDAMSKRTSIVFVRGLWADGSQLRGSR